MQVVYAASDVAVTLDILTELVLIRMNQLEHSQREGCSGHHYIPGCSVCSERIY